MNDYLMNSYQRYSPAFVSGEGAWLIDNRGERYLDALAGIAVCGLGHANKKLTAALADQAGRLIHTSNLYAIPLQNDLACRLTSLSGMNKVFFCNSGAEANEAAIKITRLYARYKNIDEPVILAVERSFHGRTMATLSATGNNKVQEGFEPLVSGFIHVPFNDIQALTNAAQNKNIVAVMLEPILGEGGIIVPDPGYLKQVRQVCNDQDWLFICDEIQTGLCRTGRWFAYQHEEIVPDVVTLAKALGNGFPIGACMASDQAAGLIQPGSHGSTFGGNPLACRAGLTVIDVMQENELDHRAEFLGNAMLSTFKSELENIAGVVSVRGKGLMIGIELQMPCKEIIELALTHHLLVNVTADKVIRLLPPLIISDDEADQITSTVSKIIKLFLNQV